MISYGDVLLTGVQSLLALAAGWGAGRWRALDAELAVPQLNAFVLRVCIPALQLWLLAVKTDMRSGENWRWVGGGARGRLWLGDCRPSALSCCVHTCLTHRSGHAQYCTRAPITPHTHTGCLACF